MYLNFRLFKQTKLQLWPLIFIIFIFITKIIEFWIISNGETTWFWNCSRIPLQSVSLRWFDWKAEDDKCQREMKYIVCADIFSKNNQCIPECRINKRSCITIWVVKLGKVDATWVMARQWWHSCWESNPIYYDGRLI